MEIGGTATVQSACSVIGGHDPKLKPLNSLILQHSRVFIGLRRVVLQEKKVTLENTGRML
jgi:hypothetical protein